MEYRFKMYRPGHAVFRYKTIFAFTEETAWAIADEWAYENGYIDFELVK